MFTGCENCTSSTLYIILSFGLVFRDKIAPPVHNYIVLAFGLVFREDCTPSTHLLDDDVELNVLGCRVDIFGTNCDQCVSMVQCCFTSTETVRLIRTGEPRTATSTLTQLLNSDIFFCWERVKILCTVHAWRGWSCWPRPSGREPGGNEISGARFARLAHWLCLLLPLRPR